MDGVEWVVVQMELRRQMHKSHSMTIEIGLHGVERFVCDFDRGECCIVERVRQHGRDRVVDHYSEPVAC